MTTFTRPDKTTVVTYADQKFENKRSLSIHTMSGLADLFANYSPASLPPEFVSQHQEILSQPRGAGYWLWKPYIIFDYLNNHCQENEMVVYIDSGDWIAPETFEQAKDFLQEKDFMLIHSGFKGRQYTKRDCFVLMDCDSDEYWDANQVYASVSFWKKNQKTIDFLEEWLSYSANKNINTDAPNICGKDNFPEFIDHRHDQSILTNMVVKKKIKTVPQKGDNPWTVFL